MTTTDNHTAAGTTAAGIWQSHHLFLHSTTEDTDRFLTRDAAPLLDRLVTAGEAADWFFIRYGQDGPHLRIRVRTTATAADLTRLPDLPDLLARRARQVPAVPGPWPSRHAEIRAVPYVPETRRYGGPRALPVAEALFADSTRTALDVLRALPATNTAASRLTAAADLAHTTAYALGMDPLAAARWLRAHAAGWRWVTEVPLLPAAAVHTRVNTVHAAQRTTLAGRAADLRERLQAGTAAPWLAYWAERVREADAAPDGPGERTRAGIWGSQLHMLFNRLGVSPDEERAVCRLAARTLLETDGPAGFFPPGPAAPDLQYLERSKFQIGRGEDSAPHPLPNPHPHPALAPAPASDPALAPAPASDPALAPAPASDPALAPAPASDPALAPAPASDPALAPAPASDPALAPAPASDPDPAPDPAGPAEIPLPADPLPDVPLAAVLAARSSLRGALTGPLDTGTLGALLWHSLAESGRSEQHLADGTTRTLAHRPYPSAGALHTARVRLLVLDVAGLPAGTYDCVPERRTLRRIGPVAPPADITALSTYLSRPSTDPDWIGIAQAPVLLALYADLGLLRRRYGLRALRLALLETGHLAQTLLLTASALGLGGTTLGGFHDDLAHELLGLHDPDQSLQYLLPLGRSPHRHGS
ncbi:thiopeptide-type bacteriocin biosynthesis protein [Streptomyces sp. CG 926]|uniref:thiopeptide-type bacteriocin biosynthesis protein n=1 Tax=Streptomyces sp. CG 926 TaxID=1882405 RepID=UPI000D7B1CB7|nr:thiopeptide-type bacteriocin biosynthesis protein [Streptomyces sp. CG 926]PWK63662.1 thiopeptide-type bacteriocin biosynthesis protein [Streptomyces sp. CG 926]